jgi:hypothetical protein
MKSSSLFSQPTAGQLELSRIPSDLRTTSPNASRTADAPLSPIATLPQLQEADNIASVHLVNRRRPSKNSQSQLIENITTGRLQDEDDVVHELEKFDSWMIMKGATDSRPSIPWNFGAFWASLRDHLLFPFNIPVFWFLCGKNGRYHAINSQWIPAWSDWVPSTKYSAANLFLPINVFIIIIRMLMVLILALQFVDPRLTGRRIDIGFELAFAFCCVICWSLTVSAKYATTPPVLLSLRRIINLPPIVVFDEQLISSWLQPDMFRLLREMRLSASRSGREGLLQASMLLPTCHPLAMYMTPIFAVFIIVFAPRCFAPFFFFHSFCMYVRECSQLGTLPAPDQPIEAVKLMNFQPSTLSVAAPDTKSHIISGDIVYSVHASFWGSLPEAECACPGDCFAIAEQQISLGANASEDYGSQLHFHRDSSKFVAFMQSETDMPASSAALPALKENTPPPVSTASQAGPTPRAGPVIPGYTRVTATTVRVFFFHVSIMPTDTDAHSLNLRS